MYAYTYVCYPDIVARQHWQAYIYACTYVCIYSVTQSTNVYMHLTHVIQALTDPLSQTPYSSPLANKSPILIPSC